MNTKTILKRKGINPNEPVLSITAEEALENIAEAVKEYCPNLEIDKMKKEGLLSLLHSYGRCVVDYHPENHHQERATLLENFEKLKQHGLTNEDYEALDFC